MEAFFIQLTPQTMVNFFHISRVDLDEKKENIIAVHLINGKVYKCEIKWGRFLEFINMANNA